MMDIQSYLRRINFNKPLFINEEVLYQLQKNHLLNVPFENLDIHYGRKIKLSIDDIYRKVVSGKRGGFCYELNGLFHALLKEIGFDAKLISARVHTKNGIYSPDYDHLAIIVKLKNKEFLVDVGFGKFSLKPLKLQIGIRLNDDFGQFQFDKYNFDFYRINEVKNNSLSPQYIFDKRERKFSEFEERCEFHQSSKDSHFMHKKIISIAKEDGRVTLNNTQLKITKSGIEQEVLFSEDEFEDKLKTYFGIKM